MTHFLCLWPLWLHVRCFFSVGMCRAVCQNTGGLDRARVPVSTFQATTTCYFIRLTLVIKMNGPLLPHMSSRFFFYDTVSISFTAKRSWRLVWYQLSKVSTSSNCGRRSALRQLWQRETPFLLSADDQNLGRGERGEGKKYQPQTNRYSTVMNGHGKVSKARKRWEQENQCLSVTTSVTCDNTTRGGEKKNSHRCARAVFFNKVFSRSSFKCFLCRRHNRGGGENDGGD